MEKFNRATVDQDLRDRVFTALFDDFDSDFLVKINDRQYGCILVDKNGVERYCRVGVIVAEEREDLTARELMAQEIAEHQEKVAAREEKARAKAEKVARDKARREKEGQENE